MTALLAHVGQGARVVPVAPHVLLLVGALVVVGWFRRWLLGAVALGVVMAVADPAHARDPWRWALLTVHLTAAAMWLGGVVRLAVRGRDWDAVREFGRIAAIAVAVVVGTGAVAAVGEAHGRALVLILAKVALVAIALALAASLRHRRPRWLARLEVVPLGVAAVLGAVLTTVPVAPAPRLFVVSGGRAFGTGVDLTPLVLTGQVGRQPVPLSKVPQRRIPVTVTRGWQGTPECAGRLTGVAVAAWGVAALDVVVTPGVAAHCRVTVGGRDDVAPRAVGAGLAPSLRGPVTVIGDGDRAVQLAAGLGARLVSPDVVPDGTAVVATDQDHAAAVVARLRTRPAAAVTPMVLAPWLLDSAVLGQMWDPTAPSPLVVGPALLTTSSGPAYLAALDRAGLDSQAADAEGLGGFVDAEAVLIGRPVADAVRLYAPTPVDMFPGAHQHGHGASWLANGHLTAISGVLPLGR